MSDKNTDIQRIECGTRMSGAVIFGGLVYLAGQVGNPGESVTAQTTEVLAQIGSGISPDCIVGDLTFAERQMALRKARRVVHGVDRLDRKPVKKAVLHHHARAGKTLFARLEHEHHRAGQGALRRAQQLRRADEHRRVGHVAEDGDQLVHHLAGAFGEDVGLLIRARIVQGDADGAVFHEWSLRLLITDAHYRLAFTQSILAFTQVINAAAHYQLDYPDLVLVLALVRGGSLARAAALMKVDVSTVFRGVRRLEGALGQALFEKSRAGYLPTGLARTLAEQAERAEQAYSGYSSPEDEVFSVLEEIEIPEFVEKPVEREAWKREARDDR